MGTPNETVFGLEVLGGIPDGTLVSSVVVVSELVSEDGTRSLWCTASVPLTAWVQLGMLQAAMLTTETGLADAWLDGTPDD